MPERAIEVIPVIDLRGGAVVRAHGGSRHSYAPIVTPLSRTSAPLDVVAGFLTVHPFRTIYAADLDRIEKRGNHDVSLDALCSAFPDVAFWADAGVRDTDEARYWLARHKRAHLVMGSESLDSHAVLEDFVTDGRVVLSLDYRSSGFLGPKGLCEAPCLWPARVIVMTLARIGGNAGPDMVRLAKIKRRAPDAVLYAAGGLRGASDLMRLQQAGVRGVLVASALHDGRLAGADLAAAASTGEAK